MPMALRFLNTHNEFDRSLMSEIAKRMQKYRETLDHNLAVKIANLVGKRFLGS